MSVPSGAIGSPTHRAIRPGRGRPPVAAYHVARPAQGERDDERARGGRRQERAQAEGAQAGGGHEGALREEEHVLAVAERPGHEVGVGDALQRRPSGPRWDGGSGATNAPIRG